MTRKIVTRGLNRRRFLAHVGQGALLASIAGSPIARASTICAAGTATACSMRLVASDGHFVLPERGDPNEPADPYLHNGPIYGFGFVEPDISESPDDFGPNHKGKTHWPAPIIAVDEDDEMFLSLTNVGMAVRIDLTDSHTVHWHGFRMPLSVFDGVPDVSIAVPIARQFTYFYPPRAAGTYMYHCHFEDVEHVQMGMQGIVFVRPKQNKGPDASPPSLQPKTRLGGDPSSATLGYAYNDGDGSTAYDREFTLLLNEVWTREHDEGEAIQEHDHTDYQPDYWVINGRSYPHTILRSGDAAEFTALAIGDDPYAVVDPVDNPGSIRQPVPSLIQVNGGERVLLRFVNLGYQQHAMQMPGVAMKVVGEDSILLRGPAGDDLSYSTNTIYLGPGESRDVLFTAPAFAGTGESDPLIPGVNFNRYQLVDRNVDHLNNDGVMPNGLGGMATEMWVYPGTAAGVDRLPDQTAPNQTFTSLA